MEMKQLNMPMVDESLIGYEIDMLFEDDDEEGSTVNVWCQGKVVSIVKENTNVVGIKQKEEGLSDSEHQTPIETFLKTKYNTQKQIKVT